MVIRLLIGIAILNFILPLAIADELTDRFGKPPEPVQNLLLQLKVKLLAHQAQIDSVNIEGKNIALRCRSLETEKVRIYLAAILPDDARITRGKILLPIDDNNELWKDLLIESLGILISYQYGRIAV